MEYRFHCSCGQRYRTSAELAGREFACTRCQQKIRVPSVPSNAAAVAIVASRPEAPVHRQLGGPRPARRAPDSLFPLGGLGGQRFPTQEVQTCLVASASALISRRMKTESESAAQEDYEIFMPPAGLKEALEKLEKASAKACSAPAG